MYPRQLDYFDITDMLSEVLTELEEMVKGIESKSMSIADVCDKLNCNKEYLFLCTCK